jgi:hypothetical protein
MSASGQKQTYAVQKRDVRSTPESGHVRLSLARLATMATRMAALTKNDKAHSGRLKPSARLWHRARRLVDHRPAR